MILWLNSNGPIISLFFSFVVMASTVVYAYLTWKLVGETSRMRQVQTEPLLEVVVEPHEKAINLTILKVKNIGLGAAFNVSFRFQAPDGSESKSPVVCDFKKSNWLATGMSYLGPGKERSSMYTVMFENSNEKFAEIFEVVVDYQNSTGNQIHAIFPIEMAQLMGLYDIGEPPLEVIAKALKEIQGNIERIASGRSQLEVITKTPNEAALERAAQTVRYERKVKRSESGPNL